MKLHWDGDQVVNKKFDATLKSVNPNRLFIFLDDSTSSLVYKLRDLPDRG